MTLRPRLLIAVVCATWVLVMGAMLYATAIWSAYERRESLSSAPGQERLDVKGQGETPTPGDLDSLGRPRRAAPRTGERRPQRRARPVFAHYPPVSIRIPRGSDPAVYRQVLEAGGVAGSVHLQELATSAATLCGVPVEMFHALVKRESGWNPKARSSAGAYGLTQLMPATAREISPTLDRGDPWQNLLGGACYLRQQWERFGTWREALHAYHGGPNRKVTIRATRDYARDIIEGTN